MEEGNRILKVCYLLGKLENQSAFGRIDFLLNIIKVGKEIDDVWEIS